MFAWMVISYKGYADRKGWPVGEMIASDTSYVKVASALAVPGSAAGAAYTGSWWSAIVVISLGLIAARILTELLRQHSQWISAIGLALTWIVGIIVLAQA